MAKAETDGCKWRTSETRGSAAAQADGTLCSNGAAMDSREEGASVDHIAEKGSQLRAGAVRGHRLDMSAPGEDDR